MELFWSVYIASLVVAWILSFILWRTLKRPYPINWKIPAGADRYTWYRDRFFPALDGGVCLPPEVFFERAKAGDWKTNLIGGVLFPGLSMRLRWEDETSGHRYYTTMDSESVQDANDLDGKPWPWVFGISMRDYDHERHGEGLRIVLFAQRRFAALLVIAGIATAIWSVFGFAISWFISSLVS